VSTTEATTAHSPASAKELNVHFGLIPASFFLSTLMRFSERFRAG
jgi:hypothetical protein